MFAHQFVCRAGLCFGFFAGLSVIAGPIPTNKPIAYPDWWFEQDVIPRLPAHANNSTPIWPTHYSAADDYAVANIGQLKLIATQAANELNSSIPAPGAGSDINQLVTSWLSAPGVNITRDDFAALNQGQLKAVVRLFYDRLATLGYTSSPISLNRRYPWNFETGDDDDYALVNLGQLKWSFSFFSVSRYLDDYLADSDLDGILNGWEIENGLNPFDAADAAQINGGLTNLEIYQASLGGGADPATLNPVGLMVYCP